MNVLDEDPGSCSNANAACCVAAKALTVLMLRSRVKALNDTDKGFFGSLGLAAAAPRMLELGSVKQAWLSHHYIPQRWEVRATT
jgi:hypothetical protein